MIIGAISTLSGCVALVIKALIVIRAWMH
jgi:hypothetical protein